MKAFFFFPNSSFLEVLPSLIGKKALLVVCSMSGFHVKLFQLSPSQKQLWGPLGARSHLVTFGLSTLLGSPRTWSGADTKLSIGLWLVVFDQYVSHSFQFTWPEFLPSSEVNVEDFWSTMETEVIEQMAFPSSIPITKFDASIVAPFFPPLMRGVMVINTEKDKKLDAQPVPGNR